MSELLNWGADTIIWAQQFQQPLVRLPLVALSWLGANGYLLLLPLVVFAINQHLGLRLVLLFAASLFLNSLIKDMIALPHPFESYPNIVSDGESGFSLPSGHAQLAVVYWGLLALHFQRRWFGLAAAVIVLLIGCSQIYLGINYPTDVLLGWLLGGATLWAWYRWSEWLRNWLRQNGRLHQLGALLVATSIMWGLSGFFLGDPLLMGAVGFFLGCGFAAIAHPPGPAHRLKLWVRGARFLLGLLLVLLMIATLQKASAVLAWSTPLTAFSALAVLGGWLIGGIPPILDSLTALLANKGVSKVSPAADQSSEDSH